jgi:hypothetical protein
VVEGVSGGSARPGAVIISVAIQLSYTMSVAVIIISGDGSMALGIKTEVGWVGGRKLSVLGY